MKDLFDQLDKSFENRIRLGIMSILVVNEWTDFNTLKNMLEVTDGNLASHLKALEGKRYIDLKKEFVGRKPKTSYKASEEGREAFETHLDALEKLIQQGKKEN